MDAETLNFWANVAAIFLFINALIITIAMGVAFGFGWWYLRKGRKWLAMPLLMAQVYTLRAQHITTQVTDVIANVPITVHAVTTQATTTTRLLTSSIVRTIRGDEPTALTTTSGPPRLNPPGAIQVSPGVTDGQ
jgi:hypothetical protein